MPALIVFRAASIMASEWSGKRTTTRFGFAVHGDNHRFHRVAPPPPRTAARGALILKLVVVARSDFTAESRKYLSEGEGCATKKLQASLRAYGAKLWSACSLLALLPDPPACWRLVSSTGVPPVKGAWPGRPSHHGRKQASAREGGSKLHALQSFAARTPKLHGAHAASTPGGFGPE